MHNIIDYMTEPRFKQLMVDLSRANTDGEVNDIILRHNQVELTKEEKKRYSDTVISDFDTILKNRQKKRNNTTKTVLSVQYLHTARTVLIAL